MLATVLEPVETKCGTLPPGKVIQIDENAQRKLEGKIRLLIIPENNLEPQWQHDFCSACGDFNNWRGCCPKSLEDCLLSRVIDAENDAKRLKGLSIGQGVKTDDVLQLWCESGELMDNLFKKPVWLFCIAEHIKQLQIVAEG